MDWRIEGLHKGWDGAAVLRGLELAVAAGERIAVVGRSGSGKSTLLHLMAGIAAPDRGSIRCGGHDVAAMDERARAAFRRRHLGLVFQDHNLVPSLDALENLRLPMELAGERPATARTRALALLETLDLAALARRFPGELSGGERQRVAVARAIAHGPSTVLADEPTASLDAESAAATLDLLFAACAGRGASLVVATHAGEVMDRADRVLRVEDGRLVPA